MKSGERKNKYYLQEYMNFLIPYVGKKENSLQAKLTSLSNILEQRESDGEQTNTSLSFSEKNEEFSNTHNEEFTRNSWKEESSPTFSGNLVESRKNVEISSDFMESAIEPPPKKQKREEIDTEQYIINYLASKKKESVQDNNAKRHFLLSLLPDLECMSSAQFRAFRHQVCTYIDEILELNTPTSQTVNTLSSRISQPSTTVRESSSNPGRS